ncbi:DNA cytosine methyltransferase [Kurthia massiliensis]|uniref:DNA cytosine methyltransferase n=1 Tax=Kurthia massiliensis TaxID=1033739 RepID=UPI000287D773|nr:DNA cytosine methyltransferase [Kurthia massiliensis]
MNVTLSELENKLEQLNLSIPEQYKNEDLNNATIYKIAAELGIDPKQILDDSRPIDLSKYEAKNEFLDVENSNIIPKRNYKAVEVFAGAGGLLLGLHKSGINSVAAIEIDKHACNTLNENNEKHNLDISVINEDIEVVVKEGIRKYIPAETEIDILSGGYPCQAFSFAGKKLGLEDTRGTMFYWYAQLLKQLNPKMFLAENVRGLVSHEKGATLQGMIDVFESMGYSVKYKVLKATDYNVAQKRERIFIIGVRKDLITDENSIEFQFPKPQLYKPVLKDVLKNVPDSPGKKYPQRKKEIMDMVPPGGCWRDLPLEVQKEYMKKSFYLGGGKTGMARRISWDEPCLTLTTAPDMKQTERCHPDETRPFTVREYARIQSFPDSWIFTGPITAQYKQIGNAVPVELANYVGKSIVHYLNNLENTSEKPENKKENQKNDVTMYKIETIKAVDSVVEQLAMNFE